MVISRTPFRISFFGGGTDYPTWYKKNGGQVLATTINKYSYLHARYFPPFFGFKYRIAYNTRIENCKTINQIIHPSVREVIRFMKTPQGVDIHYDGDLPGRSGLGSSSSLTVGLLHALYALEGNMPNKHKLAKESIYIEQEVLKETVGSQDQILAAYGGLNHITFHKDGEFTIKPVTISRKRIKDLENHLMLFYTGYNRISSDVAKTFIDKIGEKEKQLFALNNLVVEALNVLNSEGNINEFGKLLHESWNLKRSLSPVISNSFIDDIYLKAMSTGAIGGKIIGAGGGGFILLFIPPSFQPKIKKLFSKLIHVPFKFENEGSQIIFFDQDEEYSAKK